MLRKISSPHTHGCLTTSRVMRDLCLATIPGLVAMTWFYGWGTLINLVWATFLALGMEASVMLVRGRPPIAYVKDLSAVVTAVLLALTLPPYAPWWLTMIAVFFAIPITKHLYGGLGYNPFNPAMVGYAVVLISFPAELAEWAAPRTMVDHLPGPLMALQLIFTGATPIDGVTAATALDLIKQNNTYTLEQLYSQNPQFSSAVLVAAGTEWVNLAFLGGGLWLLRQKIYTWHAPVGMLAALLLLSSLWYDAGSSASAGSPLLHMLTGATMLGAFFIVTDPVSGCTSNFGRLLFGIGVGALTFAIRAWGSYPDAVAFSILLMNFAAPLIDYYTQPRAYGHSARTRVRIKKS